ncbi:unnamed protein product [Rotaria sp. Silwood1]|nr:unnamed protein product [Rotaria sp. Silwood1]CAF3876992.1 unnamed protein product [Rotaria sp. Silwood1]CAF4909917.1 unnamed protein product [Rotaria sp. Silwood1]CAF5017377.1 unnamed protein product [Rotaria sp. Silwood1]
MGKLDGKIALITGGSEGIGFATAQMFITEGVEHVFITGRRQEMLDEAVKKIGSSKVTGIQGDVSNMADLDKMFNIIEKEKGRLNIVFANAGAGEFMPFGSITEEHFDNIFNVNVKGMLFSVQKVLPLIADGGSIILNGGASSVKGIPAGSVLCATRAANRSFARCWSMDLKERKIRVNVISPGAIDTRAWEKLGFNEEQKQVFISQMLSTQPINRFGTAEEVARVALFLASDDSSYITGIEIFVDGGHAQI